MTRPPAVPRQAIAVVLVGALLLAACGPTVPPARPTGVPFAPTSAPTSAGPTGGPTTATPSGSPGPAEPTASAAGLPAGLPPAPSIRLEPLASVDKAVAIANAHDDSGRLFVASQTGQIWVISNGRRAAQPALDLAGRISFGGERGLLGLAFHPDFPADPRLFVDYTDPSGNTVVSSFRVDPGDPARIDAGSESVLMGVAQPFANHNGGGLAFGPDGFLYIALGDGGGAGDPQRNGQRLDTLLGKILRVDVDHAAAGRAYAVPAGNPLVDRAGARPEIWLVGLRNPWRFSFDRATGDLWIGDVGQNAWEEVDVARAGIGGLNFGWAVMEGFHCYPSGDRCVRGGLTLPVAEYAHKPACTVIGGYVYRGTAFPALSRRYLFGDYCSGDVFAIDSRAEGRHEPERIGKTGGGLAAFGEDQAGELYIANVTEGSVSRILVAP